MDNILTPTIHALIDTLTQAGHEARVAGGAVRDGLLGKTPKDIDLATTAHPEVVQRVFEDAGFTVVPTGLKHGTVTVVANGQPVEITTLRVDVDTDGRHAEVEFTSDWSRDAARRDFTVNAMFMDAQGTIHDFFQGRDDLRSGRVRFVGSAKDRIQEDFLRILRFFRFQARLARGGTVLDRDAKRAIREHAQGLERISGERIWLEMSKILVGPGRPGILYQMKKLGVLDQIGLPGFEPGRTSDISLTETTSHPAVVLARAVSFEEGVNFLNSCNVSTEEMQMFKFIHPFTQMKAEDITVQVIRTALVENGREKAMQIINAGWLTSPAWKTLMEWPIPEFPVRGRDLLDLGMKPGPEMGQVLRDLKAAWVASGYEASRDTLLSSWKGAR